MRKQIHILIPLVVLVLITMGMTGMGFRGTAGSAPDVSGLKRSEEVVRNKIARKQAKLDGDSPRPDNPRGYAEHRRMMRPHPEGTTTTEMLLAAKDHVAGMPQVSAEKDAGIWNWSWLGPGNIGGRIRSILQHPDNPEVMWIGAASGGVWKTTTGGSDWTPLTEFLPSMSISAMVMDPNHPDTLFAATGEGLAWGTPGAGIFRSYDGGDTWDRLAGSIDPDFGKYINDLAIHPTDGNIIFAAVGGPDGGQVWKSTDGGATWPWTVQQADDAFTDIAMDPDDPDIVLASTRHICFRSQNAGNWGSWVRIASGMAGELPDTTGRVTFAFGEGNEYVYASCDTPRPDNEELQGEVWRSTDNGQTWTRRSTPYHLKGQGHYDNVIWLEPGSTEKLMIGGINLFRSEDGGASFTVMSRWQNYHTGNSAHADQHVIVPHVDYGTDNNNTIYFGNDGGIQKSDLGFFTGPLLGWVNLANNLGITQFYHADASPDGGVILGGTQDNDDLRFYRSSGSTSWFQAETGDGTYTAVDPDHPLTMYAAYVYLKMQRTYDGGNNYEWIINGLDDATDPKTAMFVAPFALDKVYPNHLVAGGESIWWSSNGGNSWGKTLGPRTGWPLCSAVEISPSAGINVCWVGYKDGSIWRREGVTEPWQEVESGAGGSINQNIVVDIEISPHNPDVVAVVIAGYFANRVWLTTDNGLTWDPLPGTGSNTLPRVGFNCVTFHPANPDWIYVGSDIGLFASEDLGQNWSVTSRFNSSEGPRYVEVSDIFWHSGTTLVAVTYGRGIYECRPLENVFVDITGSGEEDGTLFNPFNTFEEGYEFIGPGATLVVGDGDYDETNLVIDKRITVQSSDGPAVIR